MSSPLARPSYATRHAERAIVFLASHGIDATPQIAATSLPPAESIMERVEAWTPACS